MTVKAHKTSVSLQDMYKCLVKYVLSIIDTEELSKFKETILWLMDKQFLNKLPLIGIYPTDSTITAPLLKIYQRSVTPSKNIPYMIGELKLPLDTLIFALPLCSEDKDTPIIKKWIIEGWVKEEIKIRDFSAHYKQPIEFNLVYSGKNNQKNISDKYTCLSNLEKEKEVCTNITIEIQNTEVNIKALINGIAYDRYASDVMFIGRNTYSPKEIYERYF